MIDYSAVKSYLRSKGYSEKIILFATAYVGTLEDLTMWHTKSVTAPKDNPYIDLLEKEIGEPLQQMKAMNAEAEKDIAFMKTIDTMTTLAMLKDKFNDFKNRGLVHIQMQIDTVKSSFRHASRRPAPTVSQTPSAYQEVAAKKELYRRQYRAYW